MNNVQYFSNTGGLRLINPLYWEEVTSHGKLHTTDFTLHTTYCTLQTSPCTYILHTTHCTLYTAHYTMTTAHYALHTSHCTLHTTHCTRHTIHWTLSTAQCVQFTTHYTLHAKHCVVHRSGPTTRCRVHITQCRVHTVDDCTVHLLWCNNLIAVSQATLALAQHWHCHRTGTNVSSWADRLEGSRTKASWMDDSKHSQSFR